MPPTRLRWSIQAGPLARTLACIAALLVIANCGVIVLRAVFEIQWFFGINRLFDLDKESNFPSLFSTGLFLINAALLFFVGSTYSEDPRWSSRFSWRMLAAIFFLLGIDECVSIHEMFVVLVRDALDVGGVFHFAWVIPYGIGTVVLGGVLAPWFFRLDRRTQVLFGSSAALFLLGAVGLEMVAGRYLESVLLKRDLVFQMLYTFEETLEMSGLILFAYALMDFLRRKQGMVFLLEVARSDKVTDTALAAADPASPVVR